MTFGPIRIGMDDEQASAELSPSRAGLTLLVMAFVLLFVGCGKPSTPEVGTPDFFKANREKAKKKEAAEAKLNEELKADPRPVLAFARKTVVDDLPKRFSDKNAEKAIVTVDEKSLTTFGPGEWTVRGHVSVRDKDDKQREMWWKVVVKCTSEIEDDGAARAFLVSLAVSMDDEKQK